MTSNDPYIFWREMCKKWTLLPQMCTVLFIFEGFTVENRPFTKFFFYKFGCFGAQFSVFYHKADLLSDVWGCVAPRTPWLPA